MRSFKQHIKETSYEEGLDRLPMANLPGLGLNPAWRATVKNVARQEVVSPEVAQLKIAMNQPATRSPANRQPASVSPANVSVSSELNTTNLASSERQTDKFKNSGKFNK